MCNIFTNHMKTAVVLGAGGFIGHHLVSRLKSLGYYVKGVDLKYPEYEPSKADEYQLLDLRSPVAMVDALYVKHKSNFVDEVYQLAADMGGAGYVFNHQNDAQIMTNSSLINLNLLNFIKDKKIEKIFFSSSACVYPQHNQTDPESIVCSESSVYPAYPDSEYGWEKLFSERLYQAYGQNHGLHISIARFHNIFGPLGAWNNGKEKAPAAICRKVAEAFDGGDIEIWGDGLQTRSFLFIDECLEGVIKLVNSNFRDPVNIGSSEMVSLNDLVDLTCDIAGKRLNKVYKPGFIGVRARTSDNNLIKQKIGWEPTQSLRIGLEKTYAWVLKQVGSPNPLMP